VLRACQAALAYRIRQCVLLEPDSFLGFQQRVAKDLLLLDAYDFKVVGQQRDSYDIKLIFQE
jgi:hypothetical protein